MIHLLLNGLAASAGGGLTYLRNVVPQLAARNDVRTTVVLGPPMRQELANFSNISYFEVENADHALRRFLWEQSELPRIIRQSGADVLVSTGNFALRKSPVPQILLSRNSLYTSSEFFRDVRSRRDYGLWLDTRAKGILARKSIHWADRTVAPSEAFAQELSRWANRKVACIYHGFDHDRFFADPTPLAEDVRKKLDDANGSLRILFVSHYNYYRNFETLLRAVPLLRDRLSGRVKVLLTCRLQSQHNPGSYRAGSAAALVRDLGIANQVVELGEVPYPSLHHVYRACDIYVTPAYTESFAHPLVEAMACGLPIVASDLAVHREIAADAAMYFPAFSPERMAEAILQVSESSAQKERMAEAGLRRSKDFCWSRHLEQILDLAGEIIHG